MLCFSSSKLDTGQPIKKCLHLLENDLISMNLRSDPHSSYSHYTLIYLVHCEPPTI